jgi:hypothetical protein
MAIRKAGDLAVLALLRQDKYRYLTPEDLPTTQEQRWIDGNVDGEREEELDRSELARWIRERNEMAAESEVQAYEEAVARRITELSIKYPQLSPPEVLSMAIEAR